MFSALGEMFVNLGKAIAGVFAPPRRDFMERSDEEALAHDWKMVGQDMKHAMQEFEKEQLR